MKKILSLCLLVSTLGFSSVSAQQMSLQLNKDDQTIIDPETGMMYVLDENTIINDLSCQTLIDKTTGFYFVNEKAKIINAENCYEYVKTAIPDNGNDNNVSENGTGSIDNNTAIVNNGTGDTDTTDTPTNNNDTTIPKTQDELYQDNSELSEYQNAVKWLYKN